MKYILAGFILCCFFFITSCRIYCSRPGLNVQLLGFDTIATQSIKVNAYQANTYNTVAFDSFTISNFNQYPDRGINVSEGYDYVITLPAINRKYTLKNISVRSDRKVAKECTSGLSYYINDSLRTTPTAMLGNGYCYIKLYK